MSNLILLIIVVIVICVIGIWIIKSKTKKIETPPKEETKEQKP